MLKRARKEGLRVLRFDAIAAANAHDIPRSDVVEVRQRRNFGRSRIDILDRSGVLIIEGQTAGGPLEVHLSNYQLPFFVYKSIVFHICWLRSSRH
jgi:hypothetical protein